jgi:uncharacterized protein
MGHSHPPAGPRSVVVSGSSGLLGTALIPFLTAGGFHATRLVRRPPGPAEIGWDPAQGKLDPAHLEGVDAVINLGGESLAHWPWTEAYKRRILESRTRTTELLAGAFTRMDRPPLVLVSASAVGYYGDRGDEILREESKPGTGFLAEVAQAWEAATEPARAAGTRVVLARIGMVLSPAGGGLPTMLLPFRLGLGGRLGSGRQWMSWIAMDDTVRAIHHCLTEVSLAGGVNLTSPHPVTNQIFTETIGRVLRRPTVLRVPAFAVRLALGEMGEQLLLAGQRALPGRLQASGFQFSHPDLAAALTSLLGS